MVMGPKAIQNNEQLSMYDGGAQNNATSSMHGKQK